MCDGRCGAAMVGALVSVLVHHLGRPVVLAVLFFTLALAIRGVMAEWARSKGWMVTTGISGAVTLIAFAGLPAAGYPLLGVAVGLGCLVHLIGDLITHQGVPVLWPFKIKGRRWYMITTPTAISVTAGGGFERAVLLPGLTLAACAAATWQVPEIQEMAGSVAESLTGDPAEADS